MQYVLSSKEINFPYPLGLTLLHMVFSSVLCFMLTKVLKVFSLLNIMRQSYPLLLFFFYCILLFLQIMKVEVGMTADL